MTQSSPTAKETMRPSQPPSDAEDLSIGLGPQHPAEQAVLPTQTGSISLSTAEAIISKVESYLKLLAAGAGLITALGFPAVYIQFSRLNIPGQFVSYDQVIRAGVVPAMALALLGLYIYWGLSEFQRGKKAEDMYSLAPLGLLIGLLFLSMFIVWFAGFISFFVLVFWGLAWIISRVLGFGAGDRDLLYLAVALLFVFLLAEAFVLPRVFRRWGNDKPPADQKSTFEDFNPKRFILLWTLLAAIVFPSVSMGLLYLCKIVLQLWDPKLSGLIANDNIVLFGVAVLFDISLFGALFLIYMPMQSPTRSERTQGIVAFALTVLVIYLVLVGVYSYVFYPRIPASLGGGQLASIVYWIDKQEFPQTLVAKLAKAKFVEESNLIRCEGIYLVYANSDIVIVADQSEPPASSFLVPRDKIKAISW